MAREATPVVMATPASKLRPPRVRHAEITREELLTSEALTTCEVLAVCAAAGYGKSTLGIQWASRGQRPVAWATLDESDCDPAVLLATLSNALSHAVPGFGPVPVFVGEQHAFRRTVLPGFLAAVSALSTPVTVVLDDVHVLQGAACRRLLKAFVDALPSGSQIAFLGRSLDCLPVPLWRGQGRVREVHAEDLAFGQRETEQAVAAFGSDLEPQTVHAACRGWPVAVFLLSQNSGTTPLTNVLEFIQTEVLDAMDPGLREFVMVTAALGAVNSELARTVTGRESAGQILAEAIRTVLLAPDDAGWYRYHPLMQDAVLDVWRREDPARLGRIRAMAARWFMDRGFVEMAVTNAIASGDGPTMGDVVWDAARVALLQGRTLTVLDWLDRIGADAVAAQPALSMTAAWANVTAGRYGHVLRHVQRTLHLMPVDWLEHLGDFSIGPSLALLLATSHYGITRPRQALELSWRSLQTTDPSDAIMPLTTLVYALNLALVGDPGAEAAFHRAAATAEASAIPSTRVEALAMWGLLLMAQGRVGQGCEKARQALDAFAVLDLGQMTSTAGVVALAKVALTAHQGSAEAVRAALAAQAILATDVEQILAWYKPLSGPVLAFAYVRIGDYERYQQHLSWCSGEGLCQQWSVLAQQEYACTTPLTLLTPAELRVWDLLKGRMTLSEIAGALFLSRETVKSHTSAIYRKLGVASRREAQEFAEKWR